MSVGYICGATRGHYGKPIPFNKSGIKFISEDTYKELKTPKIYSCESSKHEGRKKRYPIKEMYVRKWEMTKQELKEATDAWDMFSLEMGPIIICPECAKKIKGVPK